MDPISKTILVTGGAGFIGSAVIRHILSSTQDRVINVDKLTYAGNLESLSEFEQSPNYQFERVDICDRSSIDKILKKYQPNSIMHLAAETHVDRSIDGPEAFIQSNIVGTFVLLEASLKYWQALSKADQEQFRFHHISTDEVYGDLGETGLFTEETAYAPSSPYSASKASSDHLVRAWHRTYKLPVLLTNCSNNYGPYQFPEKLIPVIIQNALKGNSLPIYGNGTQVRDWLHVEDHARALYCVINTGEVGETYNIGGHNEKKNIEVVETICSILDTLCTTKPEGIDRFSDLITFVQDRPGHDVRYAIDASKIQKELGWTPDETFETGLQKTVEWYLSNQDWCKRALSDNYHGERLGVHGNKGNSQ